MNRNCVHLSSPFFEENFFFIYTIRKNSRKLLFIFKIMKKVESHLRSVIK